MIQYFVFKFKQAAGLAMELSQGYSRRWYDNEPETSRFVTSIQYFPDKLQTILCQGIMDLAERQFRIQELLNNVRSLGAEKVTRLLKAQNRHRNVDRNGQLHRALTTFSIMPEDNRFQIIHTSNELITLNLDYLGICKTYQHSPSIPEVTRVTTTYVDAGYEASRHYVAQEQERYALWQSMEKSPLTEPVQAFSEGQRVDQDEMRIRPERL